jgi:hypothetical protein
MCGTSSPRCFAAHQGHQQQALQPSLKHYLPEEEEEEEEKEEKEEDEDEEEEEEEKEEEKVEKEEEEEEDEVRVNAHTSTQTHRLGTSEHNVGQSVRRINVSQVLVLNTPPPRCRV